MEKSRLNAYLDLIQKLLSCPQGEEWIYLKQHEDLVNAEFLQFMEQIAIQIGQEGDRNSATFLHNWAAKLHHILLKEIKPFEPEEDRTQAYLGLIERLLACPEGVEEELLIAHETLIGPGLVHALQGVGQQLREQGDNESAQYLESIATELSQAWLEDRELPSLLQKGFVTSANRAPAPYSQSYSAAPSASVTAPLKDEKNEDDPWFSLGETATVPMTVPASIPYPLQPSVTQAEPLVALQNDLPKQFSEAVHSANTAAESSPADLVSLTSSIPSDRQVIADGLNAITQALKQLNQTLNSQRVPSPLHHLEALEKARHANWQLTTEEIAQLVGVRPKCRGNETVYQRGEWCFFKVGKLGSQTAWRVSKEEDM